MDRDIRTYIRTDSVTVVDTWEGMRKNKKKSDEDEENASNKKEVR